MAIGMQARKTLNPRLVNFSFVGTLIGWYVTGPSSIRLIVKFARLLRRASRCSATAEPPWAIATLKAPNRDVGTFSCSFMPS
jgi:hypothetical protein